jgi:3-(3-hydroxy-phenyl)propionate hydroxylase
VKTLRAPQPLRRGASSSARLDALLDDADADALLIRPDRIIAAAANTPDLRRWQRQLHDAGITTLERAVP